LKLLIVESPGKIKKISSFLGADWKIAASVGHIRDLPEKEIGVIPPLYQPRYKLTERGQFVLQGLSKLVKSAEAVCLATDPDREGEAIAWHLKETLKLKDPFRVSYTEITEGAVKMAIKKALENQTAIDMDLVYAQEGRRVLDRLVGYKVSPVLSRLSGRILSAGRVQSPALRLVVEKEKEISNFISTAYFGVELVFGSQANVSQRWTAKWNSENFLSDAQEYFTDKKIATKIASLRAFLVKKYEESQSNESPPAPFTTSTLQQAASNILKFNPKKTMATAQKLYESGHITYMRTDSPNLSQEAINNIRDLAIINHWPLPIKARLWKSKDGAQEAHEAIRPTHFELENAGANKDEKALYSLIRIRALASQLDEAIFTVVKVILVSQLQGKEVIFEARSRQISSAGWRTILSEDQTDEADKESEPYNKIPRLREGDEITAISGEVKSKKTSPPPRFTQAGLIKELEKKGIGRPSTYASIIDNIMGRHYVFENKKKRLEPSDIGFLIVEKLTNHFSFIDYDFTKNLETLLDDIAHGKRNYLPVITEADGKLDQEISTFLISQTVVCPICGKTLKHFQSSPEAKKVYDYWRCSNETCNTFFDNDNGKLGAVREKKASIVLSEFKCAECGKPLRRMVKEGQYNFWGCSGYPVCKTSYADDNGKPGLKKELKEAPAGDNFKCPKCKSLLRRLKGTSLVSGKDYDFFSCSNKSCRLTYNNLHDKPDFKTSKIKNNSRRKPAKAKKTVL